MYQIINKCRVCNSSNLKPLLNLGQQTLTGVFPKNTNTHITKGPLELVKCHAEHGKSCGLIQLRHSYSLDEMYGENYGYRSGLNKSMVKHLHHITQKIQETVELKADDLIIDIGSNDSTLLRSYPHDKGLQLLGIDPTGAKFRKFYPDYVDLIPDFFSAKLVKEKIPHKKAKVITSISMFYDLEEPLKFVQDIYEILADDGVWVFEQSYLPLMLETHSYDTVCHEHLEYYAMQQIVWMFDKVGFTIAAIELNKINGGSFRITARKGTLGEACQEAKELIQKEKEVLKLDTLAPYENFVQAIQKHKEELLAFVKEINAKGQKIFGYGASTKGNVLLQYCGFTAEDIPYIAEVNPDKFGAYTPATHIPIIDEKEAKVMQPDYFLVLPWHFKDNILEKEKDTLKNTKFVFPLPKIEVVG